MHEIIFRNPAKRFLKNLDKNSQKRILKKIEKLKENSRIGKPLTGNLRGLWRLRQDNYRIIYKIKDQELIIYVMNIGDRGRVYNK
ncbi:MAG: type II toxin-antitoxin system RelE/ParE family toxin [archaeon]